jgi:hypothetical protein
MIDFLDECCGDDGMADLTIGIFCPEDEVGGLVASGWEEGGFHLS